MDYDKFLLDHLDLFEFMIDMLGLRDQPPEKTLGEFVMEHVQNDSTLYEMTIKDMFECFGLLKVRKKYEEELSKICQGE